MMIKNDSNESPSQQQKHTVNFATLPRFPIFSHHDILKFGRGEQRETENISLYSGPTREKIDMQFSREVTAMSHPHFWQTLVARPPLSHSIKRGKSWAPCSARRHKIAQRQIPGSPHF
jgi:hypothetical protein